MSPGMFDELPRPIVFAHRGASLYAPENTLASFELALRQGADAIELDAKLTSDGHVVVIHDQTVDRTTEGHGAVKELTLVELRKLDAGSHFDVAFKGEMIPTLDEVFKAVGQLTFTNIELTNYASTTDDLPEKVAALVKRHRLTRRGIFSSFNPIALRRIHRLLPDAPIGLLALPGWRGALARSRFGNLLIGYKTLNPEFQDVTQRLLNRVHGQNRAILTYTVNEAADIRNLFELGVDGIFTDDPVLALQIRDSIKSRQTRLIESK